MFLKVYLSVHLFQMQDIASTEGAPYGSHPQIAAMRPRGQPTDIRQQASMMQHGQLTTINQSQLSAQLGLNMGGSNVPHNSPSPPGSKSATPSPSSSVHEDEGEDTSKVWSVFDTAFTLWGRACLYPPREKHQWEAYTSVNEAWGYKLNSTTRLLMTLLTSIYVLSMYLHITQRLCLLLKCMVCIVNQAE